MVLGLGGRPDVFCRIVFRSVGGKTVRREPAFVFLDPYAHNFRSVRRQSVQKEDEMPAMLMSLELFEKSDEMTRSDRFPLHGEHEPRACAVSLTDDRTQDRAMLPSTRGAYEGSTPFLRPCIPHYRTVGESCFVMETKGCFGPKPPFLSAGHTSLYQHRMPASFLSLARRTGLWFVQPADLRIFQTCPG